jgi:hypothetical protein
LPFTKTPVGFFTACILRALRILAVSEFIEPTRPTGNTGDDERMPIAAGRRTEDCTAKMQRARRKAIDRIGRAASRDPLNHALLFTAAAHRDGRHLLRLAAAEGRGRARQKNVSLYHVGSGDTTFF